MKWNVWLSFVIEPQKNISEFFLFQHKANLRFVLVKLLSLHVNFAPFQFP